ncbi:MAG: hypothetical protein KAH23_09450 [Kiritimatiellae bacterium]|nr:hypothetical protein [Kiritimatiellia bacterium]
MNKTFVGFGFGPIQSGLFFLEAFKSGNFSRFVVAEVDVDIVRSVRSSGGRYIVNIARGNCVDQYEVSGIEIFNPGDPSDRQALIEAVCESDEMAVSLPSVRFYDVGGETSVARLIGEGLSARKTRIPTVIYAAENHNRAAELLKEALFGHTEKEALKSVRVLNTVIGKMSGMIVGADEIAGAGLASMTMGADRAILVEEFNRILISQPDLVGYRRGIEVFIEKKDLLPFEEAKLYGHNAIHALIGYLADIKGLNTIAEAGQDGGIMCIARNAFIKESGAALVCRYAGTGDPLFTEEGFMEYAEDLMERMVNPHLNDLTERICRDRIRKLGYNDRLYGTMRLALRHDVMPLNLAVGAAAGVISFLKHDEQKNMTSSALVNDHSMLTHESLRGILLEIWGDEVDDDAERLIETTWDALKKCISIMN